MSRGWMVTALVALLIAAFGVPRLWTALDETGVPARPTIPETLRVTDEGLSCGSGGCARIVEIEGRDEQTAEDVADTLGLAPRTCRPGFADPCPDTSKTVEVCDDTNIFTGRKVCRGGDLMTGGIRMYVMYVVG